MARIGKICRKLAWAVLIAMTLFSSSSPATAVEIAVAQGKAVTVNASPQRIVSLVPAVTEILFGIGAGERIVGVTYHDAQPDAFLKTVVGGFFSPSIEKILSLEPDLVIVSSLHRSVSDQCAAMDIPLLHLDISTLDGSFAAMSSLGRLVGHEAAADELQADIRQQLDHIRHKIDAIPKSERLRTMRLMGGDRIMTPGDESFQNQMIAAAGGIPPHFGRTGPVIEITLSQWEQFNPQVVYGCHGDEAAAERLFSLPGWKSVDAIKNGRIYYFPCSLTCRAGVHTGDFVAWLSARLYGRHFSKPEQLTAPDAVLTQKPLGLELPYVKSAAIVHSRIDDFTHKSLLIEFTDPMKVVSTLDGKRDGITAAGNHFFPPPAWTISHGSGLDGLRTAVCKVLKRRVSETALLFTGADMDHLSVQHETFRELAVYAMVTAGARLNAMRAAKDEGSYYEPGTINVVLMTNTALSPRAMQRAVIAATEAKSAALQDLDIRSSYSPSANGATGTGTDNIIVVQGTGLPIENSGGHSRMGELISRAVYDGVRKALLAQDGFAAGRNVLQRLKERKISIRRLLRLDDCPCGLTPHAFAAAMEQLLLEPRYAAFVEAAFAVSDHHAQGLIGDLSSFRSWAHHTADQIAGAPISERVALIQADGLPEALYEALNALADGIRHRQQRQQE